MIVVRRVRKIKESANFSLPLIALVAGGTLAATSALSNPRTREYLKENPRARTAALAVMRPEALVGNSLGKVFSRRRKTKNGKVVVENVRKRN